MSRTLKYLGAVAVGGAVGAFVGLLMAPGTGRETRRRLSRTIGDEKDELVRRGYRAVGEVSDYLYDQFEESKKKLAQVANG